MISGRGLFLAVTYWLRPFLLLMKKFQMADFYIHFMLISFCREIRGRIFVIGSIISVTEAALVREGSRRSSRIGKYLSCRLHFKKGNQDMTIMMIPPKMLSSRKNYSGWISWKRNGSRDFPRKPIHYWMSNIRLNASPLTMPSP